MKSSARNSVVVVDDCEETRRILRFVFRRSGLSMIAVSSVAEAAAVINRDGSKVILCDLDNTAMDAAEITRFFSSREVRASVIFTSAKPGFSTESLREVGATAACKPFVINSLIAKVVLALHSECIYPVAQAR